MPEALGPRNAEAALADRQPRRGHLPAASPCPRGTAAAGKPLPGWPRPLTITLMSSFQGMEHFSPLTVHTTPPHTLAARTISSFTKKPFSCLHPVPPSPMDRWDSEFTGGGWGGVTSTWGWRDPQLPFLHPWRPLQKAPASAEHPWLSLCPHPPAQTLRHPPHEQASHSHFTNTGTTAQKGPTAKKNKIKTKKAQQGPGVHSSKWPSQDSISKLSHSSCAPGWLQKLFPVCKGSLNCQK